jgi:DNA-binding transcriptional MerR regulator
MRKAKGRGDIVDAEWIALIEEAKALGLTVEEIREWMSQVNSENAC